MSLRRSSLLFRALSATLLFPYTSCLRSLVSRHHFHHYVARRCKSVRNLMWSSLAVRSLRLPHFLYTPSPRRPPLAFSLPQPILLAPFLLLPSFFFLTSVSKVKKKSASCCSSPWAPSARPSRRCACGKRSCCTASTGARSTRRAGSPMWCTSCCCRKTSAASSLCAPTCRR